MRGKLKNFKVQLLRSNALFLCRHEDTSSLLVVVPENVASLSVFALGSRGGFVVDA